VIPPVPPELANGGRQGNGAPAEALLGISSERPSFQSQLHPANAAGFPGFRVEVLALSGVRSAAWEVSGREGLLGGGGDLPEESQQRSNEGFSLSASAPAEEPWVLPSPQTSDVLTALRPFDWSALELGMQQFLGQLEGLGQGLATDRDGTSLSPWIAAVAAAATACEIARRQLRRPVGVPAVDVDGLSGSPPDDPSAG
jgi:hypothetical protein